VKEEQKVKRQAELKMLQAQINPHFLFNTLNSFKWVAMLSQNNTLNKGLESLSVLLRNTILNKNNLVPIEEELDNLSHYANIQKIRYGASFTLESDIAGELKGYYILKFILQPIVENSIIHATEEEAITTKITVKMREISGKVIVTIADNGQGFDTTLIKKQNGQSNKLSGIGIDNVNERIKIHYGSTYGLTINSELGKGTTTTIVLPVLSHNEGDY
jgi:two-component system sensor histidine kinase YesM